MTQQITDLDREVMRRARGAIVRHVPTGLIGHAYPKDPIPGEYVVIEDYRGEPTGVLIVADVPGQLELFEVAA